ncbi:glycosyltransferase family 2 protein [Candidatus Daviesbacteria bacterium]|nr:glycosyltransferase family 2 protein [Candidatus Daviesbacteria bacterium]
MKKIRTSVIIPNWNGQHLLEDCLKSLERQSYKGFEVILADNGSKDSSVLYVNNNFPKVRIIKLDKNYGFAKACNEGARAAIGEYLVFLNNDTSCDKDFLKGLVSCAHKHPEVFSVNSKLLNFYNRKKIDGVGILINEVGQAKSIGWEQEYKGQFEKENYIFGATGGASLFRKKEFTKLGMFDQNYFMYSEEVDLAFRAQFQGYKSIYYPKAVVYHKHKATAKKSPALVEYWQFRNMTQTIIKDFPAPLLLKRWRWLKIILVHFNTIFYQLKKGFFWSPVLADLWIIYHLPKLLLERRKIQKNIKVDLDYIEKFLVEKKISFWGLLR